MIVCEQVGYMVQERRGRTRTILHPVSFTSNASETALIRGPSGAGKTTLLSILAGVLRPTQGQVVYRGNPVSRYSAAHRDRFRRQVGLVPQGLHLFDGLTVLENVLLPLVPIGVDHQAARRAIALLDTMELPSQQRVQSLSGGERQRVAIARAFVAEPALLVLDEPTSHQDDARVELVAELIDGAMRRETVVVIAAHDRRLEQKLSVSTTVELSDGQRVAR